MAPGTSDLSERAARNEDQFRKINEAIEPMNATHVWFNPDMPDWVCECGTPDCAQPVTMTVAEYEAVRAEPTHFLVAPSQQHVLPGVERVVAREERYWIIEKVGEAGEISEELDER